jgi:hypothetical protein
MEPGRPRSANAGEVPPRGPNSGDHAAAPSACCPSRTPEPPDHDPTILIGRYRFSLVLLLKSPRVFLELTRTPVPFRNICSEALFLLFRPLDSLEIELAVQP